MFIYLKGPVHGPGLLVILPGCSELDPLVEQPPVVKFAEQPRLGDRVGRVALHRKKC